VIAELLSGRPAVVNVGIREFAESVADQGAQVVQVDWSPPRELDDDLTALLDELE
jgi:hypothetical protein